MAVKELKFRTQISMLLQREGYKTMCLTPPEQILRLTGHKTHVVYVSPFRLATIVEDIKIWCTSYDFMEAYPEKWQEIQAELALQKLKDS